LYSGGQVGYFPTLWGTNFSLKKWSCFCKKGCFWQKMGYCPHRFCFFHFILLPLDSVLNTPLKTPTPEYFSEKISYMQEIKSTEVKQQWKKVKAREAFHKIGKNIYCDLRSKWQISGGFL